MKTVQINVRLDPEWRDELERYAKMARMRYGEAYSVQDIIRQALVIARQELLQRCRPMGTGYKAC